MAIMNQSDDDQGIPPSNDPGTVPLKDGVPEEVTVIGTPPVPGSGVTEEITVVGNYKTRSGTASNIRLKNPLGYCSSYTYQLSLYMITPDAYDAFVASGRKNLNANSSTGGGAFLIAQSGGINSTPNGIQRAPGFKYDLGIDKLTIKTVLANTSPNNGVTEYSINFEIVEPYGFSFVTNLQNAQRNGQTYSNLLNHNYTTDLTKQFYILGIRFFGYDKDGNVLTGSEIVDDGTSLDPNATGNGLFTKYYDISITHIKFKIDGKSTVYNIDAVPITQLSYSSKRGTFENQINITASTVKEAIDNFIKIINDNQERIKNKTRYSVVYVLTDEIANAKLVTPAFKSEKDRAPGSGAVNISEVTVDSELKQNPDLKKIQITQRGGKTIVSIFEDIIKSSTYMTDRLRQISPSQDEPDDNNPSSIPTSNDNKKFAWYTVDSEVSNPRWDKTIGDWIFDIVYYNKPYTVVSLNNPLVTSVGKYKGPIKRYDYWFTGKNSEIISYTQEQNTTWFNILPTGIDVEKINTNNNNGSSPTPPVYPGKRSPGSKIGALNTGQEAQNSVLSNLFDPQAYAIAKINILGDPDFLGLPNPNGSSTDTIDGSITQQFIEIGFKEAVDYDLSTGSLSINDKILFWPFDDATLAKLKNYVPYRVYGVTNTFMNGSFKQMIEMTIHTDIKLSDDVSSDSINSQQLTDITPTTGLYQYGPPNINNAAFQSGVGSIDQLNTGLLNNYSTPSLSPSVTNTKGVVDDDSYDSFSVGKPII
jgi:hypothetical protein